MNFCWQKSYLICGIVTGWNNMRRTLRVLEIFYILIWLLFKEVCLICEVSSYVCFSVSSIYVNKIFISNFSLFSKLKNSRLVFFFQLHSLLREQCYKTGSRDNVTNCKKEENKALKDCDWHRLRQGTCLRPKLKSKLHSFWASSASVERVFISTLLCTSGVTDTLLHVGHTTSKRQRSPVSCGAYILVYKLTYI